MDDKTIAQRIERLEKAVFAPSNHKSQRHPRTFAGAAGGARLLIAKHFFRQGRTAAATKSELERRGYVYRIQVVQTALNRHIQKHPYIAETAAHRKKVRA